MIRVVKSGGIGYAQAEKRFACRSGRKIREILSAVRTEGDVALRRYTEKFDGASLR